jgi:Domain of unknown function (DUF4457)
VLTATAHGNDFRLLYSVDKLLTNPNPKYVEQSTYSLIMETNESDTLQPKIKIRPTTTGDINPAKTTVKLGKRSEARNAGIIDSSYSDFIVRPRAPRTRQPHSDSTSNISPSADFSATKAAGKTSEQKIKRPPKTQNLSDQWDSLSHFERSNIGRTLGHSQSMQLNEIHYINLDDTTDNKPNSSTTKANHLKDIKFMVKQDPMENLKGGVTHYSSTAFSIPELPRGKRLSFNILSTWGDPHYLGLMGIEVFDRNGHIVRLTNPENQIWACPADINILPEYNNDPRTVDNLVDGVNHTSDDLHAWLTPFTMGQDHLVTIDFDDVTTVSMIRIWNYNKSRIHSYRGARYVEISFVEPGGMVPIFKGEIKRAIGSHSSSISEADACSECILFTRNDQILALIEKYDPVFVQAQAEKEKESQQEMFSSFSKRHLYHGDRHPQKGVKSTLGSSLSTPLRTNSLARSSIGSQSSADALADYKAAVEAVKFLKCSSSDNSPARSLSAESALPSPVAVPVPNSRRLTPAHVDSWTPSDRKDSRPSTAVGKGSQSKGKSQAPFSLSPHGARPCSASATRDLQAVTGCSIHICALSSWGDRSNLMGVTGMTGMDATLQEFALPVPDIFMGYIDEDKTIKRLGEPLTSCEADVTVNGVNLTMDISEMWIGETPTDALLVFHFQFDEPIVLKGIRLWNYNASREGSCAGLKRLKIFLDGVERCDIIARKAPGEYLGALDYGQFLSVVGSTDKKQNQVGSMMGVRDLDLAPSSISTSDTLGLVGDNGDRCGEGSVDGVDSYHSSYAEVCLVNQQYQTPVRLLLLLCSCYKDTTHVSLSAI